MHSKRQNVCVLSRWSIFLPRHKSVVSSNKNKISVISFSSPFVIRWTEHKIYIKYKRYNMKSQYMKNVEWLSFCRRKYIKSDRSSHKMTVRRISVVYAPLLVLILSWKMLDSTSKRREWLYVFVSLYMASMVAKMV